MRQIELPNREDVERYGKSKQNEADQLKFSLLPLAIVVLLGLVANTITDYLSPEGLLLVLVTVSGFFVLTQYIVMIMRKM